jgi:hypothetical protein
VIGDKGSNGMMEKEECRVFVYVGFKAFETRIVVA